MFILLFLTILIKEVEENYSKLRPFEPHPIPMARTELLQRDENLVPSSIFDSQQGEVVKSRAQLIERKIEALESLTSKVSNRRSRRWLNDRLLIELVPRLNVDEIRGLFAPPPWGDSTPLSAFCMTNIGEWDAFRHIDMDAEVTMMQALNKSTTKRKEQVDSDKMAALRAWHRVDCRTREALKRNFLSDLVLGYEERILAFIKDSEDDDMLMLHIQDPFHRLLLHGVCEFYNLISVTISIPGDAKMRKVTKIKKKLGSQSLPSQIKLTQFLRIAKDVAV
ncbi:R3H domain-containing protein [Dioscorea alata]|uniref:R3H domain-containing protein n=1 Tax=Dioscorea alata TaxID=55571 RepID=A0ACB7V164_DIOAL|nr:R3H domain-containing protein [Dioscorea alata]